METRKPSQEDEEMGKTQDPKTLFDHKVVKQPQKERRSRDKLATHLEEEIPSKVYTVEWLNYFQQDKGKIGRSFASQNFNRS
jgi:hypothetical protein